MCFVIIQSPVFQVSTGEVLCVDDQSALSKAYLLFDPFQVR